MSQENRDAVSPREHQCDDGPATGVSLAALSSFIPSLSRSDETAVPTTSDQKNGPRPRIVMSDSAIANANSGPRTSDSR